MLHRSISCVFTLFDPLPVVKALPSAVDSSSLKQADSMPGGHGPDLLMHVTVASMISRVSAHELSVLRLVQNRIIAACTGSLVTSFAVNPFDVARVRMQQASALEHVQMGDVAPETPIPRAGKQLKAHGLTPRVPSLNPALNPALNPSQLGVTVCCKDVFWYPTSIQYCVAADSDPCVFPASQASSAAKTPSSTIGVLRNIVRNEGGSVLWRGVSLLLVQAIPANVVYFIAYEQLRDGISEFKNKFAQQAGPLAAGGLARTLASSIVSPLELLKTRVQSITVPENSNAMTVAVKSIREMITTEGYRSLWSGLGLTLWRDVPFSGIYWYVVEHVRSYSPKRKQTHTEKFAESFVAGIIGGVSASIATTPFDVAKTRRQLGHHSCTSARMNMIQFMGTIVRAEGWRALFVGLVPRTFKVAPACAIMITSYEMGKRVLKN